jgi:Flp pilus assembly protein TadG
MTVLRRGKNRKDRSTGQSLVEFALVFPMFFILFLGVIEFAFSFNAILAVNFAARNAALAAAEAGATTGADCVILGGIEGDVAAPANRTKILRVEIYRAKSNGDDYDTTTRTVWTRNLSVAVNCTRPDLTTFPIYYTRTSNLYPETSRCNIMAGCPGAAGGGNHTGIDHVGVRIFYDHAFVTPLRTFVGSGNGITFDRSNVMRMEPIL